MRWHHHQHRDGAGDVKERWPGAEELWEETSAYLCGRSAELFIARREPVPSWAFLNAPTHRSGVEVLDLAEQPPAGPQGGQRWDAVPIAVAAALVVVSYGSPTSLVPLQLERLLPLEQALINGDVHVRTPGELVHVAVLALYTGRWRCRT
jgi:hypothetical protein